MFLQFAYGLEEVIGPNWIDEERYDILANVSTPTTQEERRLMMQVLLEERFNLGFHKETRIYPGAILVVGKNGIKNLKPVEDSGTTEVNRSRGNLVVKNASMASIARVLGSPLGNMPVERTLDLTDLVGHFNIALDLKDFNPRDPSFANYQEMRRGLLLFVSAALESNTASSLNGATFR